MGDSLWLRPLTYEENTWRFNFLDVSDVISFLFVFVCESDGDFFFYWFRRLRCWEVGLFAVLYARMLSTCSLPVYQENASCSLLSCLDWDQEGHAFVLFKDQEQTVQARGGWRKRRSLREQRVKVVSPTLALGGVRGLPRSET